MGIPTTTWQVLVSPSLQCDMTIKNYILLIGRRCTSSSCLERPIGPAPPLLNPKHKVHADEMQGWTHVSPTTSNKMQSALLTVATTGATRGGRGFQKRIAHRLACFHTTPARVYDLEPGFGFEMTCGFLATILQKCPTAMEAG